MKTTGLAVLMVSGFMIGLTSSAQAEVRAGDILWCGGEVNDALALTRSEPATPTFGPRSAPQQPQGLLRCGIAPGSVFRVIESVNDRLIVELKQGRVNTVTAENGGASRDLDRQYFAIPKDPSGSCEVLQLQMN